MRVLVTGGSGYLGAAVLPELCRRGHDVVALARSAAAAQRVVTLGATPCSGDLDDAASLDDAFLSAKADVLLNLASLGFGHAPAIVSAAEEAGIDRAVFISTTAIYTSLPATTKAVRTAAEETVAASGLSWTMVRPTMIYGTPGDRNMERLLSLVRRAPVIPLPGGGRHLVQPVHVADLAWFVATAMEHRPTATTYDVGGPAPLSLHEVVRQAAAAVGRRPVLLPVPLEPVVGMVRLYERVARRPRLRVEQVRRLNEDKNVDITSAQTLGFAPREFADGIAAEARLVR